MISRYRLTPRARDGLHSIAAHVADSFGRAVAERVVGDLVQAFELLAKSPGAGHTRKDLTRDPRVLFWAVGPTLIAYRVVAEEIHVLFVERGEIDWERMLRESQE